MKLLSARGIVNSICSKNHFHEARLELEKLGVWDYFVFPRIEFAAKGPMIKDIVEAVNLRATTIFFIDDNQMNLNEAVYFVPGLQISSPDCVSKFKNDSRFLGKGDPQMERLGRYKVLEQKSEDQKDSLAII